MTTTLPSVLFPVQMTVVPTTCLRPVGQDRPEQLDLVLAAIEGAATESQHLKAPL
ncbi:hypothetical protein [Streptomyces sp. NPDC005374]|uniref:hypothetical protein n=1 Tax=Streptomyces sp. NPDC005374 TaxID=3364713 RepID=UPI0036C763D4